MPEELRRTIQTTLLSSEHLYAELEFPAQYFQARGYETCEVFFTFFWAKDWDPGDEWEPQDVPLRELVSRVKAVESMDFITGKLGDSNTLVTVAGICFFFCHESDIHLEFAEPNQDTEAFYSRWQGLGYESTEWLANDSDPWGPEERLR